MSGDPEIELYRQHGESVAKYTHFLLAASGAAIGLAVNQTQGLPLSCSQIPLALAVICWGCSFFSGCRHIQYMNSGRYANFAYLRVRNATDRTMAAASEGIREAAQSNYLKANSFGRWQFAWLVAGAIFYVGWHVYEMYLRVRV